MRTRGVNSGNVVGRAPGTQELVICGRAARARYPQAGV